MASILGMLAGGVICGRLQESVFVLCAVAVLSTVAMSLGLLRVEKMTGAR